MKTPPTAQAMVFAEPDHDEELQRAELYGALARLWFAPPTRRCSGSSRWP